MREEDFFMDSGCEFLHEKKDSKSSDYCEIQEVIYYYGVDEQISMAGKLFLYNLPKAETSSYELVYRGTKFKKQEVPNGYYKW